MVIQNRLLAVLLAVGLATPACAQFQPVTCKNAYTRADEIAAGDKFAREVYQQMPVLPDSDPVSRYVEQLGKRLVAAAPLTPGLEKQWPFRFHVVASDEVNAFALPGGTMFVNLGAVQAAETEAQLAGVMAHEMSHVILRHSTCNLTKQQHRSLWYGLGQIASIVALGNAGGVAAQGIGLAANLDFLHMSRADEQQADLLGVRIAHDAGFDPRGLPQFFEIIQAKYGSGGAQFLSDHPNPGNRTEYISREIALLPPLEHPIKTSAEFAEVHRIAAAEHALTAAEMKSGAWKTSGLYATAPTGVVPGPSGVASAPAVDMPRSTVPHLPAAKLGLHDRLVPVQFSSFAIKAPSSWSASSSSGQMQVITLAPPGGSGDFGLGYGVLLGIAQESGGGVTDQNSLAAASDRFAQQLMQADGLSLMGSVSSLQVGGQPATSRELRGTSPVGSNGQPEPERDWLVTVARPDGDLDYLIFVAPESDFAALRPLFSSMLQSFKPE